jgi:hypothetical protein
MKPSDYEVGATVKITGVDFTGMVGKVVARPPQRYVYVQFEHDDGVRSHPLRVDEIERAELPNGNEPGDASTKEGK